MKNKYAQILKGIFISSVGSLVANNEIQATPYKLSNLENENDEKIGQAKSNDNTQKYILKIHDDDSYLITGHRSHRSHSSHQSHYSHRSSSTGSTYNNSSSSTTEKSTTTTTTTTRIYSLGDRVISQGTTGKDVRELANLLVKIDYISDTILIKDNFGNVTYCKNMSNAIKKFQQINNLKVDGIVGITTINLLKSYAVNYSRSTSISTIVQKINLGDRILKKGMEGTDVTQLKNILIDKGYLSGILAKGSTLFDADIENAVIKFQKYTGIDTDGIVEIQTVYFLKK